jgi:hypothetical protein
MSGPEEAAAAARCWICSRPTYDPSKRERPWARAVSGGHQVLVCPACQDDHPSWSSRVDRCARCGGTRLSAMLGEVVCRACGEVQDPVGSRRDEFGDAPAGA